MEDSNKDRLKSLEESTTNVGCDNTSKEPLQYMGHTESIKKEKDSFYPGDIKQDDGNVADTVNRDKPFLCNSTGFEQTIESNVLYVKSETQDNSLDNAYYGEKIAYNVKCEVQGILSHNTHHDDKSVCDVKCELQETLSHNTPHDDNSVCDWKCEPQETLSHNTNHDDNSVCDVKCAPQETLSHNTPHDEEIV